MPVYLRPGDADPRKVILRAQEADAGVVFLSGTSTGQSSASAVMRYRARLVATSTGHSSASAAIRARVRFIAQSTGQSSAAVSMRVRMRFTARSDGQSSAAAVLTYVPGTIELGPVTSTGQSTAAASIRARVRFTAQSVGISTAAAVLSYVAPPLIIDMGVVRSDGVSTARAVMIGQNPVEGGGEWPQSHAVWERWIRRETKRQAPEPVEGWTEPAYTYYQLGGRSEGKSAGTAAMRVRVRFNGRSAGRSGGSVNPALVRVRTSRQQLEKELTELMLLDAA